MLFTYVLLSFLIPVLTVVAWRVSRRRMYAREKTATENHSILIEQEILHALKSKVDDDWQNDSAKFIELAHERSIELQTKFQDTMSLAIGCVFTAFLIFSIEVSFDHSSYLATKFVFTLETALLVIAIILFKVASKRMWAWVRQRAVTELHRQKFFLGSVLQFCNDTINHRFKQLENVDIVLPTGIGSDEALSSEARRISNELMATLHGAEIIQNFSQPLAVWYRSKRVARQAQWFNAATHRLESFLSTREMLLLISFALAIMAGVLKAVHYWSGLIPHFEIFGPILTLVSHIALATTAGLAAFLLSQNSQYLIQRYRKQISQIQSTTENDPSQTILNVQEVFAFERLMSDELEDFIAQHEMFSPEISL